MTYEEIRTALLAEPRPHDALATPDSAIVYAVFLNPRGLLLPIKPGANGLLYVGASSDGQHARNHYVQSTSHSSLRRTLGAILRWHLGLNPTSRAGESESFAFPDDSEIILSRWMRANLLTCTIPAEGHDLEKLEVQLIAELQPPLNLTHWENPQRTVIKKLRADCVALAKTATRVAA